MAQNPFNKTDEEKAGLERGMLMVYSIFMIMLMMIKYEKVSNIVCKNAIFILWLFAVLLVISKKYTTETRFKISAFIYGLSICVAGINAVDLNNIIPIMYALIIVVGMYGEKKISAMYPLMYIPVFVYRITITKDFDLCGKNYDYEGLYIIITMCIAAFLITGWNKKRNENISRLQSILQVSRMAEISKDNFLANISHELRTPLNTISCMSELMLQQDLSYENREKLTYIQMAGRNLLSNVDNILDFSELQSGKTELDEEEYSIATTINELVNMTTARIDNKQIEFVVDCDMSIPGKLYGDEKKIRRIAQNIIDNAISFTDSGYVILKISSRKEVYGVNLQIEIKDSGMGIEEEKLKKIFEGFNEWSSSNSKRVGGIGLGLAISRLLMNCLGGVMSIESKLNEGTSVKLVIPQKVVDSTPVATLDKETKDKIHAGVYLNFEEYISEEIRDAYQKSIMDMIDNLDVKCHVCASMAELKRRYNNEQFTYIFISYMEYMEEPEYFDNLSDSVNIVVVVKNEEAKLITNEKLNLLYRPFYILSVLEQFKNASLISDNGVKSTYVSRKFVTDANALVIDDNKMNLMVIQEILENYGMKVTIAESGMGGIMYLADETYDIVFLDHMMPDMDGIETLEHIRDMGGNYYRNLPVVALTANAVAGSREKFISYGFNEFMGKPIDRTVLERVLLRNLPESKIQYIDEIVKESDINVPGENNEKMTVGDFDTDMGIAYCGGKENYIKLLGMSELMMIETFEKIKNAYETEDWKNYTIYVHSVKSSMKSIGAMKLSDLAKDLEAAGKEDNITYIHANHQAFCDEFMRVLDIIRESPYANDLQEDEPEDLEFKDILPEEYEDYVKQFEMAVFDFDEDRMNEILNNLKNCCVNGKSMNDIIKRTKRKVEMADYMSALDLLANEIGGGEYA